MATSGGGAIAQYEVSYPGVRGSVTLNLPVGLIAEARNGNTSAQRTIFAKYRDAHFAKYKSRIRKYMGWNALNVVHIGGADESFIAVDEHCCDSDRCAVCNEGNHGFCRNGCTIGRRW